MALPSRKMSAKRFHREFWTNNPKSREKGERHLEPVDTTVKFQASPHKVQRQKTDGGETDGCRYKW